MIRDLKKRLYFMVAAYFGFWAKRVLRRWQPYVVVITGSSGKTTTLHMVEAQLGSQATYSHHANSAIGIPFHILGLEPNVTARWQWLTRVLQAPYLSFRQPPSTKLYIVETDCDRPHEGAFLAALLKPAVTLWVSVYRTHSMNFDAVVRGGQFKTHEEAIAYEFGNFAAQTSELVLASDQAVITNQLTRVPGGVQVERVGLDALTDYKLDSASTSFSFGGQTVSLPGLHARTLATSIQLVSRLLGHLKQPLDPSYKRFVMPPGRSNIFKGKKDTILIDSTYNTGLDATLTLLELFKAYPADRKWLVLGDILEQGSLEQEEHQRLGAAIQEAGAQRIILLGSRTKRYTLPILQAAKLEVVSFERPNEVLGYLETELQGGEAILFKGGRFLEGVIEQLLNDPADAAQLVRREAVWTKRRQAWGLPG